MQRDERRSSFDMWKMSEKIRKVDERAMGGGGKAARDEEALRRREKNKSEVFAC